MGHSMVRQIVVGLLITMGSTGCGHSLTATARTTQITVNANTLGQEQETCIPGSDSFCSDLIAGPYVAQQFAAAAAPVSEAIAAR